MAHADRSATWELVIELDQVFRLSREEDVADLPRRVGEQRSLLTSCGDMLASRAAKVTSLAPAEHDATHHSS